MLGKKIRITSQLNDAFEKNIIWSGKFDNDIDHKQHILDAKISELKSVQNTPKHVRIANTPKSVQN